jgi:hypothetical protein
MAHDGHWTWSGAGHTIIMTELISHAVKRLQDTFGGSLTADSIFLYFGPNDKKLGRQFAGDPNVDEKALTLAGFSVLPWLDRFASWHLGAKLMPPTPPPPGVAIKKAAALAEGKDADKAVQEARAKVGSSRTPNPAAQHWVCQTKTGFLLIMRTVLRPKVCMQHPNRRA